MNQSVFCISVCYLEQYRQQNFGGGGGEQNAPELQMDDPLDAHLRHVVVVE